MFCVYLYVVYRILWVSGSQLNIFDLLSFRRFELSLYIQGLTNCTSKMCAGCLVFLFQSKQEDKSSLVLSWSFHVLLLLLFHSNLEHTSIKLPWLKYSNCMAFIAEFFLLCAKQYIHIFLFHVTHILSHRQTIWIRMGMNKCLSDLERFQRDKVFKFTLQ